MKRLNAIARKTNRLGETYLFGKFGSGKNSVVVTLAYIGKNAEGKPLTQIERAFHAGEVIDIGDYKQLTGTRSNPVRQLKAVFGKAEGFNYAVKVPGVDPHFFTYSFGRQIDDKWKINEWANGAQKGYAGAKGKATVSSLKEWVKVYQPDEFYAQWRQDSSNWKDDVVEVLYKKHGSTGILSTNPVSTKKSSYAFDVILHGKNIDTVFHSGMTGTKADMEDDVYRSLVNHDGYDPGIKVRRRPAGK
jgi:hypothetical protein